MTHHYTAYKPDLGDPTLFALRFSHYENGDALAAHIKKYSSSLLCLDIHPQFIIAQFSIVPNNHGRLQVVKVSFSFGFLKLLKHFYLIIVLRKFHRLKRQTLAHGWKS